MRTRRLRGRILSLNVDVDTMTHGSRSTRHEYEKDKAEESGSRVSSLGRGGKENFTWNSEAKMIRGLDKGLDPSGGVCGYIKIFCAICHKHKSIIPVSQ